MNKITLTILLTCLVQTLFAQNPNDAISNTNFNKKYLEHLVKVKIDSLRTLHNCKPLVNDSILYVAASHHSKYMKKKKRIGHYETNKRTKTPQLRAEYYGAKGYSVGENVLTTYYNVTVKMKKGKKIKTSTYDKLSDAIVLGWKNSPGHFKNIITSSYQITGVSIEIDAAKKSVYACQKFARVRNKFSFEESKETFLYSNYVSKPLVTSFAGIDDQLATHQHQWDLKHDQLEKCERCEEAIKKKPHLTLSYKKKRFILRIENSDYVKQLIQNKYDGFAVEIVEFNDYHCKNPAYYTKPSRRNGQCRLNGTVLKPLYRKELFEGYKNRKPKENFQFLQYIFGADSVKFFKRFRRYKLEKYNSRYFEINLGRLPEKVEGRWGHNLVYLQNKQICHIDYFTNYYGDIFKKYQATDFVFPTVDLEYSFKLDTKIIVLNVPFEKNIYTIDEDHISKFYQAVSNVDYKIDSVHIKAFSSVEGDAEGNHILQEKRALAIIDLLKKNQKDLVNSSIEVSGSWDHFYAAIQASEQWNFLSTYSKNELQKIVNTQYVDSLEYILKEERKAIVTVNCTLDATDKNLEYYILKEQQLLTDSIDSIKDKESDRFKEYLIQYRNFYTFAKGKIAANKLDTAMIAQLKMPKYFYQDFKLIEAYLMSRYQYPTHFKNNKTWLANEKKLTTILFEKHFRFLSSEFIYNYTKINTENLQQQKIETLKRVENLFEYLTYLDAFRPLSEELRLNIDKLVHNLNVLLLNKYFNTDATKYGEDAYKSILHLQAIYQRQGTLTDSVIIELAKTAVFYKEINLALTFLMPHLDKPNVLAYALPMYYQHNAFDTNNGFYKRLIAQSEKMDSALWCSLFLRNYGVPFQAFDDEALRSIYCGKCR